MLRTVCLSGSLSVSYHNCTFCHFSAVITTEHLRQKGQKRCRFGLSATFGQWVRLPADILLVCNSNHSLTCTTVELRGTGQTDGQTDGRIAVILNAFDRAEGGSRTECVL